MSGADWVDWDSARNLQLKASRSGEASERVNPGLAVAVLVCAHNRAG